MVDGSKGIKCDRPLSNHHQKLNLILNYYRCQGNEAINEVAFSKFLGSNLLIPIRLDDS